MAYKSIISASKVTLLLLGLVLAGSSHAGEEQRVQSLLLKKQEEVLAVQTELSDSSESSLRARRLKAKLRRLQGELKELQMRKSSALEIKE